MAKKNKVKKRRRITREEFRSYPRSKKVLTILYALLRLSVIGILIAQVFNRNFANVFTCVLTLILFTIPSFIERRIKINVPDVLEIIILLFIFSAEILGEISEYYITFPRWDDMLHTINGFLMGAIGLSLINVLNRSDKVAVSLSPLFVALTAFCFSMMIGVMWEFFEYAADMLLATDMQKDTFVGTINTVLLHPDGRNIPVSIPVESVIVNGEAWQGYIDIGLHDTIKDMFVNFIGAVVFSVAGFFYAKFGGTKAKVVETLMLSSIDAGAEPSPPEQTADSESSDPDTDNETTADA